MAPDGSWYPPEQYDYWVSLQPRHLVEPPETPDALVDEGAASDVDDVG